MSKRNTRKREASRLLPLVLRPELVGAALVILALFTLLSLLSVSRGPVADAWIRALFVAVGLQTYLAPILLGAVGIWLCLWRAGRGRCLEPGRVAAVVLLWLATSAGLHAALGGADPLGAAARGQGGGYLGWALRQALRGGLGGIGAWVAILAGLLAGILLLFRVSVADIAARVPAPGRQRTGLQGAKGASPARDAGPAPLPGTGSLVPPPGRAAAQVIVRRPKVPGEASAVPSAAGEAPSRRWELPSVDRILDPGSEVEANDPEIRHRVKVIEETLAQFEVPVRVVEVSQGPTVTQFGVEPGYVVRKDEQGDLKPVKVKVSRIMSLNNDLALALAASPIRIEAPVPGRSVVGIEVPNSRATLVRLRTVVESEAFTRIPSRLRIALGQDVSGQPVAADLAAMPHLLVAGATGSGKSVCINSIVACLLLGNSPEDLRLIMIDPKMVEMTQFNGVPHLLMPTVVELERVAGVLQWATREMDRRYRVLSRAGARNVQTYNAAAGARGEKPLPLIVILVDELADLMMVAPDEVERAVCRIAQMARATGIHLVLATQRPSVDVVTGLIKANFPARISFAVTSQVDSRVILDTPGAEKLLGRGDMLYMAPDSSRLRRLQGCYVSDEELTRLVDFWKDEASAERTEEVGALPVQQPLWPSLEPTQSEPAAEDELLARAEAEVRQLGKASISLLQRRLRIGYTRAARLMELLEAKGVVGGSQEPGQPRRVLSSETAAEAPPNPQILLR